MRARTKGDIRIASYNIRKALGTDRLRRPERILHVISQMDADIVVLQEADRRFGQRPSALPEKEIEPLTGLVPLKIATNDVSLGWHGNAILVRPGVEAKDIRLIDLPGLEPRGAVCADLSVWGMPMRIAGTHLGLLRRHRRKQLTALIEELGTGAPMPSAIAGDLNEWSTSVGLGRLHRHFEIHAPGQSYHARRPVAPLDRIALDNQLIAISGGVVETPLAQRASDHLPIWMDVRFDRKAR